MKTVNKFDGNPSEFVSEPGLMDWGFLEGFFQFNRI